MATWGWLQERANLLTATDFLAEINMFTAYSTLASIAHSPLHNNRTGVRVFISKLSLKLYSGLKLCIIKGVGAVSDSSLWLPGVTQTLVTFHILLSCDFKTALHKPMGDIILCPPTIYITVYPLQGREGYFGNLLVAIFEM